MTKIAIAGAGGRMGRVLVEAVHQQDGTVLAGALERADSEFLGMDAGELAGIGRQDVSLVADTSELSGFDVLIDFTRPEATVANVQAVNSRSICSVTDLVASIPLRFCLT